MKKLRERLNSKKGFTLVELIVVIVIILILAAVLIPNVMRYIGSARESAFQSEASGYLTELQGYEAEYFAKENKDLDSTNWSAAGYTLTKGLSPAFVTTDISAATTTADEPTVCVSKGAVTSYTYSDGTYTVYWTQSGGWNDVEEVP